MHRLLQATLLFILLLFCAGCAPSRGGVLQVGIERTPQPYTGLTATVSALTTQNAAMAALIAESTRAVMLTPTPGPSPTPTRTPTPGPSPTRTPTPPPPTFSNLRLSTQAQAVEPRLFFVAGISRLYAFWDYENLTPNAEVRRIWHYQGEEWLVGEDDWDISRYGTSGTIQSIINAEDEAGLPAGAYTLSIFINGLAQDLSPEAGSQTEVRFWLFEPSITDPVPSPDRSRAAMVEGGTRLVIEEPSGDLRTMAVGQEISSIAWFPDNRNLLYNERDRTGQTAPDDLSGITHKLWLIDLDSGQRTLLATAGENLHSPSVSPTGRYVAVLAGAEQHLGCQASPALLILQLDEEMKRQAVFSLADFANLPGEANNPPYPDLTRANLRWETPTRLSAPLSWACPPPGTDPTGIYTLDLPIMQIERIE